MVISIREEPNTYPNRRIKAKTVLIGKYRVLNVFILSNKDKKKLKG